MLRERGIVIMLLASLYCATLSAQLRTLPTRTEVDKQAHPTLSTSAKRGIQGLSIALGEIDDSRSITLHFTLHNVTGRSVQINEFRPTCSCLRIVTKPTTLHGGESLTLEAEFNPAGRRGEFEQSIYVYSSLDSHHPTERLTLTGTITSTDRFPHLRRHMGPLRLSRTSVVLDYLREGATRSERIVIANDGSSDLTLSAESPIEGLRFSTKPTTLRPGEEGELVISYTPRSLPQHDIETVIIVEGVQAQATERMIKITIKR